MKTYKILLSLALILAFALSIPCVAMAADSDNVAEDYVVDGANMLTSKEEEMLEDLIAEFVEKNGFDLYVVTITDRGWLLMDQYARGVYSGGEDGIILLVEYVYGGNDNEFLIVPFGYGEYAFNSYGVLYIEDEIVGYLGDDYFYRGFEEFVDLADDFLREAREGEPYSESNKRRKTEDIVLTYVIIFVASLAVGLITVSVMKKKMNNARPQKLAHDYIKSGSFNLKVHRDIFLYSQVTRTRKSNSSSSSGGGSRGSGGGRRF